MQTTYDKGKCDKDGTIVWLTDGFEKTLFTGEKQTGFAIPVTTCLPDGYGEDGRSLQ